MKIKSHPNLKNRVGEKYITSQGYEVEIIEYFGASNCTVKLEDNLFYNVSYDSLKQGKFRNPLHKTVSGVGYLGTGKFDILNNKKVYMRWQSMIKRCYSEKELKKCPTYKDVTICDKWLNYQVFAEWHKENYIENYQLDKDILVKGNKVYSPETSCFVPLEINYLFTKANKIRNDLPIGVIREGKKFVARFRMNNKQYYIGTFDTPEEAFQAYKQAKEAHIKEMSELWKDRISTEVYRAMQNYRVEITD